MAVTSLRGSWTRLCNDEPKRTPATEFLRSCSQVYHEASLVFYGMNLRTLTSSLVLARPKPLSVMSKYDRICAFSANAYERYPAL